MTIVFGTEGSAFINRDGYRLYDRGGKLVKSRMGSGTESGTALGGGGDVSTTHVINFFDGIRGKATLNSPIEEMMKSTHLCHLANIASRLNKDLIVDPQTGRSADHEALKLWSREYAPGWEPKLL